jgi:hypothetical protein
MTARRISTDDVTLPAQYGALRAERRRAVAALKRNRRIEVGPFVTFYFESFETMLHQVNEMLFIEKGGEAQIAGELAAYNPLIPNGSELTATMMIEIEDAVRRARLLGELGNIENKVFLRFAGEMVSGQPDGEEERTNESGKTSSVHFLHFPFTGAQIAKFKQPGTEVVIGISHEKYRHMAVMAEETRQALAGDFE